ncbi:MAG: YqhA family protein [Armatimonadetes bacterium]|nr:YqhA family protein [Armatimonadota bacterium]
MSGRWESGFERALWGTRLMVLVAVVISVLLALGALALATVEAAHVLALVLRDLAAPGADSLHTRIITGLVRAVDGYLLTAILLIFAFGLYELFISRIHIAESSEVAPRLLLIRSLDDLKDRLAKVVVLILVITFFQEALQLRYDSPRDLLYLALGTLFVGGALYLSSRHPPGEH